ncbi:TPA: hypothetical protein MM076_005584 [Klebsiella variicola subsp. variicola]|uniref:hypothetical protein n=1 Tax=Klebsiella variicola TaxID=244366 RepID=UPI000E2D5A9C|nr:hypothetical protein [Klebsiella variicola]HBW6062254.1 hypothetical protein [Klebsiella pneumoniae]HBZ7664700.1 hypothetical protein [Klebsiella variicola subsp. variicola]SXE97062.1 Uncharacterised protein [Klebsiella variicola]HBV9689171.1 hypothetical protein [Klebsiella variicola]HBW6065794.1 hypothetical protein [Klebsiella pneumoniae]
MTFEDAYIELCKGNLISGRFCEGEYVTMTDGVMTLHSPEGDIVGWTPSNADRISSDWSTS